jgi:hypothetical protein
LIELLIVIALLLIVLGIGYTLYFYAHNSFTNYEQRWIVQNEVRGVSRYLKNQVKTIYKCEILTAPPTKFNDENIYIWGEDNDIYIRYVDDNGKAITAVLNNEADLTIEFRRGTDSKGNVMNRLLQFEVSGASANYSLTNVFFNQIVSQFTPTSFVIYFYSLTVCFVKESPSDYFDRYLRTIRSRIPFYHIDFFDNIQAFSHR